MTDGKIFSLVVFGPPVIVFVVAVALDLLSWRIAVVWLALCGALLLSAALAWWPFELTSENSSPAGTPPIRSSYAIILGIGYAAALFGYFSWLRIRSN